MRIFITGAAGFIGSALVRQALKEGHDVLGYDALTYAGSMDNLAGLEGPGFTFVKGDVRDKARLTQTLLSFAPACILHLAAETHVDRSIDGPRAFIETNVGGTLALLEAARNVRGLARLIHVSTDEVFGELGPSGAFDTSSPHAPRSPYAASKAAADHLTSAWHATYGLPTIITHCTNNYGPRQLPEKLIPLAILKALAGAPIPIYGAGAQVRDWLHVDDHACALLAIAQRGRVGARYAIGARSERTNKALIQRLCAHLDRLRPAAAPHARLITFVEDRPGHDARYAIDPSALEEELGWAPRIALDEGLAATARWYLAEAARWQAQSFARQGLGRGLGRGRGLGQALGRVRAGA